MFPLDDYGVICARCQREINRRTMRYKKEPQRVVKHTKSRTTRNRTNNKRKSKTKTDEKIYEVDYIVEHKYKSNQPLFRVRWVGYLSCDDTWEPISNFLEMSPVLEYNSELPLDERAAICAQIRAVLSQRIKDINHF